MTDVTFDFIGVFILGIILGVAVGFPLGFWERRRS